jgi:hypothetical protein
VCCVPISVRQWDVSNGQVEQLYVTSRPSNRQHHQLVISHGHLDKILHDLHSPMIMMSVVLLIVLHGDTHMCDVRCMYVRTV